MLADSVRIRKYEDKDSDVRIFTVGLAPVIKASKGIIPEGQTRDIKEEEWAGVPHLPTPLPVEGLLQWYGRSQHLRPNVSAMVHGVTGYGWKLTPVIDFDSEEANELVETAIYLHNLWKWKQDIKAANAEDKKKLEAKKPELPTPEEVEATKKEWAHEARMERAQLTHRLNSLCYEMPWNEINRRQEMNQNIMGWGAWEVIRDPDTREIVRLKHVEPWTLRLVPLDPDSIEMTVSVPVSDVHYADVPIKRRFRRIVQWDLKYTYFKEFGDPRVLSPTSGKWYANKAKLQYHEPAEEPANEILWFSDYHPGTPYGMPPWHGISPAIRGSRLAADNVVDDLQNSSIPRAILAMTDSRAGKGMEEAIRAFFNANHEEVRNRMLFIEAMTEKAAMDSGAGIHAKIQFIPLQEAQKDDATFLKYQDAIAQDAAAQFGIPLIMTARTREYNRATADAAKEAAEENVFDPKRDRFDDIVNDKLLRDMGIRFWKYESKGPVRSDPEKVGKLVEVGLKHGVLTPVEARPVFEKLLGIDLTREAGPWQRQPKEFTLAGIKPPEDVSSDEATGDDGEEEDEDLDTVTEKILYRLAKLERAEGEAALAELPLDLRWKGEQIIRALDALED